MERVSRSRCIAILLLFAVVLSLFGFRMYGLQVRDVDPDSNRDATYTTWSRVTAARGEILDRNGNVLVTNRASFRQRRCWSCYLTSGGHPFCCSAVSFSWS